MYNGNISETYWRTSSDNVKRKYGYFYDELNRLKDAVYQKPNATVPVTNSYNESLTYDKNGNVKRLFRNGEYDDAGYFLEIDKLKYIYHDTDKNKLIQVIDEVPNPNGFKDSANNEVDDYKYDDFGNMESDANKGITRISYNHLNLPIEITFAETKHIRYLYNAAGQKISKTVTDGSVVNITEYLDGYQYIKPGADNYKLYFFPHAEGYVNTIGGNNYVFNYTDHLGNIRLSYGLDRGVLTVLEENNYYPYGLKHENYNVSKKQYEIANSNPELVICNNCDYKYKYNGKEFQDEFGLNMTAMDMRMFDSAIARWVVQDPVVHHFQSPYNGFDGNPVYWADPSGADVVETKDAFIFNGDDARGAFSALMESISSVSSGEYDQIQMLAIEGESGGGSGGETSGDNDPPKKTRFRGSLKSSHGEKVYTLEEWYSANEGSTYGKIKSESAYKMRYVRNPIDGNVMDMRHVSVVGYGMGNTAGDMVEHIQYGNGDASNSAYDIQDYYSNKIGAFFKQMREHGSWKSDSWAYDFKRFILTQFRALQPAIMANVPKK